MEDLRGPGDPECPGSLEGLGDPLGPRKSNKVQETNISTSSTIWQYWLWSFQGRDTKLERFLHKNQHTRRKFLNFENWTSGEPQ